MRWNKRVRKSFQPYNTEDWKKNERNEISFQSATTKKNQ